MTKEKILVVEGEPVSAFPLQEQLRQLGYNIVATAETGEKALQQVKESSPDLVLMDIVLQGEIDGVETAARIRRFANVPIIYVSAHSNHALVERAKVTQPYGYLIKPVQYEELRSTVEIALDRHEADEKIRALNEKLQLEIEERKQVEASLKESEAKYRALFKKMLNGFAYCKIITDENNRVVDFVYLDVNDAFERLTTLKKEHVIGKKVTEAIPAIKELHPELFDIYGKVALTGEEADFNIHFKPLKIWLHITVYSPQTGYFVAVFENITERKRIEEEQKVMFETLELINMFENWETLLQSIQERLRQWSHCEAVGIRIKEGEDFPYFITSGFSEEFVRLENHLCSYDKDGNLICDSEGKPMVECMCGNILCGRFDPSKTFFTSDGSFWSNCTTELLATTTDTDRKTRTRNRCNSVGYESVALIPLRSGKDTFGLLQFCDKEKGRFTPELIALYRRIADNIANFLAKKHVEKALKASEEKYREVLETLPALVCGFSSDNGKILFVNDAYCKYFEKTKEELIGKSFLNFIPEKDRKSVWNTIAALNKSNSVMTHEHPVITSKGIRWQKWTNQALLDNASNVTGYQSFGEDITDRRQAEEERARLEHQLRQSQKIEAIGALAGGIAHDFNNLLVPIMGFTEMIQENLDPATKDFSYLERVIEAAHRAKDLVSQILLFSRKAESKIELVQVKLVVHEALELLRASIPTTISITKKIEPNIYPVMADATQLHQVIMNLCVNACYAMPEGGELNIRLENVKDYKFVNSQGIEVEGPFICLSVQDTGCGMDKQILEHIFEPFFTTRKTGTGLGLSVVLGIVKQHKGDIKVDSEVGRGTTFRIYLPALKEEEKGSREGASQQILRGEERILFIDDNEIVNKTGTALLENLGYRVTSFTDVREALERFRKQPQNFDVVVTDYTMPHITGAKLAEQLREIRPDIPIVLCTGYNDAVSKEIVQKWNIDKLLMKPYEQGKLSQAVRQVLGKIKS